MVDNAGKIVWIAAGRRPLEDEKTLATSCIQPQYIVDELWQAADDDDRVYLRGLMQMAGTSLAQMARHVGISEKEAGAELRGERLLDEKLIDEICARVTVRMKTASWVADRLPGRGNALGGTIAMSVMKRIAEGNASNGGRR